MRITKQSGVAALIVLTAALTVMPGRGSNSEAAGHPTIRTFDSGGNFPEGIGIDASDNVWIANGYTNNVVELSPKGKILNTITVGRRPHGLKIDRANTGDIWVMNTASDNVTALSPDGTVISSFAVGSAPQHAQFDATGNIWVTNQGDNNVAELVASGASIGEPVPGSPFNTGKAPHAIARDQAGNFWIGNYYDGTVTVLSSTGSLVFTIPKSEVGGEQPSGNDIDPLGNLWQSVQSIDGVAVLAAAPSFANLNNFAVGVAPRGVTIDKAGNVFVANQQSNEVLMYNSTGKETAHFKVGRCPENMAVDSKGDLWVTNACSSTVTEIKGVAVADPNSDNDSNG